MNRFPLTKFSITNTITTITRFTIELVLSLTMVKSLSILVMDTDVVAAEVLCGGE